MQLTREHINILECIEKNIYIDKATAFRLLSPFSDSYIDELLDENYISAVDPPTDQELVWYVLSPKGLAFLSDYRFNLQSSKNERRRQLIFGVYLPLGITITTNLIAEIIRLVLR